MASSLRRPDLKALFGTDDIDLLWERLASRPFVTPTGRVEPERYDAICPGQASRVLEAAERALARRVDLLGSGWIELGRPVDWLRDYKTGSSWPLGYRQGRRDSDPVDTSDVKFPWEISRLQWLIPAGQAYLLTDDERFATAARELLDEWIAANPYAQTVNWAIAMEPALRILTWTWFFQVFARSQAWRERSFRRRFLVALIAHAHFVERHLERSDVSGNHLVADGAGLVFAGLFFGDIGRGRRWARVGWNILESESARQVHADGADFEASSAYHRLVTELLLLPALYRKRAGLSVDARYIQRLARMGSFVAAYSRPDGSCPLWGDADDGRSLPFGSQSINDHRYLIGLIACAFVDDDLRSRFSGPRDEVFWLMGHEAADSLSEGPTSEVSAAFADGGVYVMRSGVDHVFVDCGPVGMSGRGGHGHNDCLSFELVLDGVTLISDAGTFVYTASPEWRNRFRGTSFHNTPIVDDEEQNRFVDPSLLWVLRDDAKPLVQLWRQGTRFDGLRASHSGYLRLSSRVRPVRTFVLDKIMHRVAVLDDFQGRGDHLIRIPFHFAPGVEIVEVERDRARLRANGRTFVLGWHASEDWDAVVRESWVSPSYGTRVRTQCLEFRHAGPLRPLLTVIAPVGLPADLERVARDLLAQADSSSQARQSNDDGPTTWIAECVRDRPFSVPWRNWCALGLLRQRPSLPVLRDSAGHR
jgi:uncharacterized heparinase superfamily protein